MARGKLQLARFKGFDHSVIALDKRGGPYHKAAGRIRAAIGNAEMGGDPLEGLRPTKHGENRIEHCVKYDLNSSSRLITWQSHGFVIFLYCGTHDQSQAWLDKHRGLVPTIDGDCKVSATYVHDDDEEATLDGPATGTRHIGFLHERIPEKMFDKLVADLPRGVVRRLESLDFGSSTTEITNATDQIADGALRAVMFDVLGCIHRDNTTAAIERIRLHTGVVEPLDEFPISDLPEIIDSEIIKRIPTNSRAYAEALSRYARQARYQEWMLFMHPEQDMAVAEDFEGSAKLVGVSGSGKTCVVVKRAVRLAERYPRDRILVLTINRALANLIDRLVDFCADDSVRDRIEVTPFFELCRDLLLRFEPESRKVYVEVTWKIKEHVDEIWREYYRCEVNNYDARVLQPIHDSLIARGWNAERYLREELDWVRSAVPAKGRDRYLSVDRNGRAVPLPAQFRTRVLDGLRGWEDKMEAVGVVDGLGIATAVARYLDRIEPEYRCVLVDEGQDFGNLELQIVRQLVAQGENDLFISGDAAQAVTSKYQCLREVSIAIPSHRSKSLRQNYRNSRDILEAAHGVLTENLTVELMDREDFEIFDPELSAFSASTPLLLRGEGLDDEIRSALAFCRDTLGEYVDGKACVAICGFTLYELGLFGKQCDIPVLDGSISLDDDKIFLSDMEQTKGFEFDVVCILNCREGVVPSSSAPENEQHRDLARLYVAMTRAKTDLVISWSENASPFVHAARERFLDASWREYLEGDRVNLPLARPETLEHRVANGGPKGWRHLTGEQFLYTEHAMGISTELAEKLRELVDGKGLRRRGRRARWRTMQEAVDDYVRVPTSRPLWGPEVGRQLSLLCSRLG